MCLPDCEATTVTVGRRQRLTLDDFIKCFSRGPKPHACMRRLTSIGKVRDTHVIFDRVLPSWSPTAPC